MDIRTLYEQRLMPSVIDDTDPDNIYLGYFLNGDPTKSAIIRLMKCGAVTRRLYAYGMFEHLFNWTDKASITDWRFRDFPEGTGMNSCPLVPTGINLGYLYNRYTLANIAPAGTRVTSAADWLLILAAADPSGDTQNNIAAALLKDPSLSSWNSLTELTTGLLGFNAKGVGDRGSLGFFSGYGYRVAFWNSDLYAPGFGMVSEMTYNTDRLNTSSDVPYNYVTAVFNYGCCIRLVKESTDKAEGETGYLVGNDEKVYRTKVIAGLEIMIDNLAETKDNTGADIPSVSDNSSWQTTTGKAKCAFNNDESNVLSA